MLISIDLEIRHKKESCSLGSAAEVNVGSHFVTAMHGVGLFTPRTRLSEAPILTLILDVATVRGCKT